MADHGAVRETLEKNSEKNLRATLEILYPGYGVTVSPTDPVVYPNSEKTPPFTTLDIYMRWY